MATIYGTSNSERINGTENNDIIYGWARGGDENSPSGNDELYGRGGNDELYGGTGNDTLDGGAGIDTLIGGRGNDTYIVDSTTDIIREYEGGGSNDLVKSSVSYTLGDWVNDLTLTGTGAINGTGNSLDNVITGNDATNILRGGAGNDTIDGKGGSNTIYGEDGNDSLYAFEGGEMYGGNGNDYIRVGTSGYIDGGNGNDTLQGGESQIYGGAGNDTLSGDYSNLYGGEGDDVLRSSAGAWMVGGNRRDTLIGGDFDDYFVFNAPAEGVDTIKNFGANQTSEFQDLIVVSASGFGGGLTVGPTNMPMQAITPDQFVLGTAAVDASDRFIYNNTNGALFFDKDGTGALGQVQFATLAGAPEITNNNIVVIA